MRPVVATVAWSVCREHHEPASRRAVKKTCCYSTVLVGTARIACRAGSVKRYGVCPSVCPRMGPQQQTAAVGLLLLVRRAGDIYRLLQQRRAVGDCGQCHVVSVRYQGYQGYHRISRFSRLGTLQFSHLRPTKRR